MSPLFCAIIFPAINLNSIPMEEEENRWGGGVGTPSHVHHRAYFFEPDWALKKKNERQNSVSF